MLKDKKEKDTETVKSKVGRRIKQLREKRNLTQADFSELIGLNRTFLIHIEKGRKNVSIASLEKIVNGLGVNFGYFFKSM